MNPRDAARGPAASVCPRCGAAFHCGVNDAAPCACFGLQLSPGVVKALRERYATCVCGVCLGQIVAGASVLPTMAADDGER